MSRDMTAEVEAEVTAPRSLDVGFINMQFDSGDLNLWTGAGQITWNSMTFIGVGGLIQIERISETNRVRAVGQRFKLTGIPVGEVDPDTGKNLAEIAMQEPYQGRPILVWAALLNSSFQIINDPIPVRRGSMDVMRIKDTGTEFEIELFTEGRLATLRRRNVRRRTDEDQQLVSSGDRIYSQVNALQELEIELPNR